MDLSIVVALFNIVVGLMLVAAMLFMGGGLMLWYVRLGTYPTYRDEAIGMMEWACAILFVLVVLLGVAQYVQTHMAIAMMIVGVVIFALIAYFVATTLMASGGEEEEHH
jgi:hypothetical protein